MEAALLASGKMLAPTLVKSVIETNKSAFKNISAEIKQLFDDGLTSYLGSREANYSHTKTILHRHEPVPFYDIYFPVKLERKDPQDSNIKKEIETISVNKIFLRTRFITITGNAGSGKSTLVKHVFLNCIKEGFGIPIIIELRNLVYFESGLYQYIKEAIFINELAKSDNILERLLIAGKFIFLIDGFDEVKRELQNSVLVQLNSFIDKYKHNRYMLTSRPGVNLDLFPFFHNYKMKELEGEEIYNFIKKQKLSEVIANSVIDFLKKSNEEYLKTYLSNPLLLTLYLVTYSNNSTIPSKRSLFYRRVFDVLIREHDTFSKVGYERNLLTQLSQEKIEETLKLFSFITFFDNHYTFDRDYLLRNLSLTKVKLREKHSSFPDFDLEHFIYYLKVAIGIWVEDESYIYFVHRSMQEYFAALSIQNASVNKEGIYRKILNKLDQDFSGRISSRTSLINNLNPYTLKNFLSLCSEMDTFSYNKYVKVPLMRELVKTIDKSDPSEKINAVFKILGVELNFKDVDGGIYQNVVMIRFNFNKFQLVIEDQDESFNFNFFHKNFVVPKHIQTSPVVQDPFATEENEEKQESYFKFRIDFNSNFISLDWISRDFLDEIEHECDAFILNHKNELSSLEDDMENIAQSEFTLSDLI